jgi:hypothetical protein
MLHPLIHPFSRSSVIDSVALHAANQTASESGGNRLKHVPPGGGELLMQRASVALRTRMPPFAPAPACATRANATLVGKNWVLLL